MSAGSKCLEHMIAGRPQGIMAILRNQSNNKENLPRTHASNFWSQPFFLWREYTYVRKVPKSSMDAPNGSTRQRKVVSVMFFHSNCFYGRKTQGNLGMSAGSTCLENMIAGRLQDIMVILRNQCNNKANLLVTLDSASHSLLREYTYFPDR